MNLKFKNVLGGLKLQLKGTASIASISITGNNNEVLCGAAEVTVANGNTPSINLTDASAKTVTLDCGAGVALNSETATPFIIALPPITMIGGFTVIVTDTEGKQMEIKTTKSQTITRSSLLKMPAVNYVGTPVLSVLSETESANCYIINSPGYYAIKATKGNSDESVGDVKGVRVLWESRGTSIAPSKGEYISSVSFENELIYFRTNDVFKNGNAVIAAYSDNACSDGNVLWSWHIWFTDTPLKQIYYNYSGYVMDRNLGAINDKSVGLMYQWGRKDPFMGAISTTSNTLAKATPSFASAMKTTSLVGTIDYAIAHPTTFLLSNDSLNDWIYYGTSTNTPDHTRWAQTKTIYDPCPIGWHIPPSTLWEKASGGTEHYGSIPWRSPSAHKYDLGNDDTIWYPTAGAIRNNDGVLYNVGSWGGTWSYTKYVPGNPLAGPNYLSKNFAFWVTDSQAWGLANSAHATGYPVRCVTDIEEDPTAVKSVYLVSSISLGVGDTYQLNPSVSPYSATDKSIVFNSTNTSVATVSSDGLISAVASGQCRIIATAASGKAAATSLTIN
ncbi:MAG: Ig-like domain-containing protein, partial [Bacteroidales bacterium]|nr:Ig-like domain-containing protein [Bacteroidales bacterium]